MMYCKIYLFFVYNLSPYTFLFSPYNQRWPTFLFPPAKQVFAVSSKRNFRRRRVPAKVISGGDEFRPNNVPGCRLRCKEETSFRQR
ncbi:hypothetical protein HanXRQr2_Chr16g0727341 [Helianthus annuus]|uniref:Uncharacterized protein n=1 Tax=Helianthus annuus TaxID=4232 RepID=A0A251RWM9_HELAN|nr:hypothetical protein HanXRQr2_Chr16g0727341 [Helianthus annuus]